MGDQRVTCMRCGRVESEDSARFLYGEVTEDGQHWSCEGCLTGEELSSIEEETERLADSLDAAGLADADLEAMADEEYAMREELARVLQDDPGLDPGEPDGTGA